MRRSLKSVGVFFGYSSHREKDRRILETAPLLVLWTQGKILHEKKHNTLMTPS